MVDVNLTFKVFADADAASNETVSDLKQAYITGPARAFKVEFGDGSYFQADMIITKFSLSSAVDDAVTYDIEICPAIAAAKLRQPAGKTHAQRGSSSLRRTGRPDE